MVATIQELPEGWVYIQSLATGKVISATTTPDALRSQVYVLPPKHTDHELWRWEGQFIKNKATGMVLDIRKGRLRLIEDTEICLYTEKSVAEAHNQLWGVRKMATNIGESHPGYAIYSICNDDWVLDIQFNEDPSKLILFPYQPFDNDNQRWTFVSSSDASISLSADVLLTAKHATTDSTSPMPTDPLGESNFTNALTPAKRGSQSSLSSLSVNAFKECHQMVYLEKNPHLSDKTIGMAAAYKTWQDWKVERSALTGSASDKVTVEPHDKIKTRLQSMAKSEASLIYQQCDQLSNHPETLTALASRFVTQLYEQMPSSP
ncbi:uncharacterized protein BYT42DRAFT_554903 [Radiomyces spectabilis]|uniref:uncharacterized protein n=1 Tax=Radiomyces spectabilis TaxID=64574 RepID=UPI00221FAB20|nr:uncharacterized protein BYT42DRAFT_554903 [Radiomyces spectabilis]KAI8390926.1 hypothetical protein BYT42DRAFT_554903 [Radiomyces spectabilis]